MDKHRHINMVQLIICQSFLDFMTKLPYEFDRWIFKMDNECCVVRRTGPEYRVSGKEEAIK